MLPIVTVCYLPVPHLHKHLSPVLLAVKHLLLLPKAIAFSPNPPNSPPPCTIWMLLKS